MKAKPMPYLVDYTQAIKVEVVVNRPEKVVKVVNASTPEHAATMATAVVMAGEPQTTLAHVASVKKLEES